MSDLFHEDVPWDFIRAVFKVMGTAKQHTFQVLTKRPKRMRELILEFCEEGDFADLRGSTEEHFPWKNVWLGVSCEDQKTADERIPLLLQTPAAVRFISAEPLLGPICLDDIRPSEYATSVNALKQTPHIHEDTGHGFRGRLRQWHHNRLDWVIVGGESGPGARPCDLDWIRSIIAQCKAAGTACFVKQLGARVIYRPDELQRPLRDRKGGDPSEWPEDVRVREFPKVPA